MMANVMRAIALFGMLVVGLPMMSSLPAAAQGYADDRNGGAEEFIEALEPYGEWIRHRQFGTVWVPEAGEDPGWRPYTRGRWVLTDEHGWYWESDEPFGWAVYHYGRWHLDRRHGWIWVPGRVWGPAWVAWREGEDAIGWAPLPPEAVWDDDGGPIETYYSFYDAPRYAPLWVFVHPSYLIAPYVWRHALPFGRNAYFLGRSRYVTHYARRGRGVFNRGVDPRFVARFSGRAVPRAGLRMLPNASTWRGRGVGRNAAVGIYRPEFGRGRAGAAPRGRTGRGVDPGPAFGRDRGSAGGRGAVEPRKLPQAAPAQPVVRVAPPSVTRAAPPQSGPSQPRYERRRRFDGSGDRRTRTPTAAPQQRPPATIRRAAPPRVAPPRVAAPQRAAPQRAAPAPARARPQQAKPNAAKGKGGQRGTGERRRDGGG